MCISCWKDLCQGIIVMLVTEEPFLLLWDALMVKWIIPRWECCVPNVGMPHSRRGKIRPFQLGDILVIGMLSTRASDCKKTTFFKKVIIPPVNSPEPLYIKASLVFHPSLGPSRHLSHIPPVIPHSPPRPASNTLWTRRERWRERYGRDRKHPSRAQTPLYKGISEDDGRDERFLTHGDRSREFLNKPVYNLSLTANDGGGAISINIYLSLSLQPPFSALLTMY